MLELTSFETLLLRALAGTVDGWAAKCMSLRASSLDARLFSAESYTSTQRAVHGIVMNVPSRNISI